MPNSGLDSLVSDPQFMGLPPADQRKALAGVSGDQQFNQLSDPDTMQYVTAHRQAIGVPPIAPPPQIDMKTSMLPNIVRGAGYALPAIGGMAGGVVGAPAFGGGAVVGAGLGAAAGETGRQAIMQKIFGPQEGPSPISKQGLKQTAMAGGLAAASEIPAAIAQGYGNFLLKRLADAKSANQVGDVVEAFKNATPSGVSAEGLKDGLKSAQSELSDSLTETLSNAQGTTNIDQLLQGTRTQAAVEDQAFSRLSASGRQVVTTRVSNMVNDAIAAAKSNAGITGSDATAQQLMDFQQQLQDKAFKMAKINPTAGGVAQRVLQGTYRDAGTALRQMAPDAGPLLDHMTDIHAAMSALRNYQPGAISSIALSAATHPRTAAVLSPLAPIAATEAGKQAKKLVGLVTQ